MTIRIKLLTSFAVLIALLFGLGWYTMDRTKQTRGAYEEMLQDAEFRYQLMSLQNSLAGLSNDERGFLLNGEAEFEKDVAEKGTQMTALLASIRANPTLDESDLKIIDKIDAAYKEYEE